MQPMLFAVSGPSGVGKTTVCQSLLATNSNIVRVITCTTRPPRNHERDGLDYHFLAPTAFEESIAQGDFIEYVTYNGHRYGTRASDVLDQLQLGQSVLLILDVNGVSSLKKSTLDLIQKSLVTIFILPPATADLRQRLSLRGESNIDDRIAIAHEEVVYATTYDHTFTSSTRELDLLNLQKIVKQYQ